MSIKLKPCPFCGHKPVIKSYSTGRDDNGVLFKSFNIICEHCRMVATPAATVFFDYHLYEGVIVDDTELQEIIKTWNQRACTTQDATAKEE